MFLRFASLMQECKLSMARCQGTFQLVTGRPRLSRHPPCTCSNTSVYAGVLSACPLTCSVRIS